MTLKKVKYDEIASDYSERYNSHRYRGIHSKLLSLVRKSSVHNILEVGCGTGFWLSKLEKFVDLTVGLDISPGMLKQAKQVSKKSYLICGDANGLPFINSYFDLIFCVNSIHHFSQKQKFIYQSLKALRPGGILAIIGMDPHVEKNKWYVYNYFKGTYEHDLARFPSRGKIKKMMANVGFKQIKTHLAEHIIDPKFGREILVSPFLKKHNSSQLVLLSDKDYCNGLDKIKADIQRAKVEGESIKFEVDIALYITTGIAP